MYEPLAPPIWTNPGGIVWVGLATWLLINFGVYAAAGGAFVLGHPAGIGYLADHRLRPVDLQQIVAGRPVRDAQGRIAIDPAVDSVRVFVIDESGRTELTFATESRADEGRPVFVFVPHPEASYADIVAAIDRTPLPPHRGYGARWLVAAGRTE